MAISRRTVLKYGLGGAVVLALGGIGLAVRDTVKRQPKGKLQVLTEREFSILWAVAETLLPGAPQTGETAAFPPASDVQVAEKVDAFLARSHPGMQTEVRQVLGLLENALAGSLFDGRFQSFTASDALGQAKALDAWRHSKLQVRRTAYRALHGLCAASYYASPEVYPSVGYPGPPSYGNFVPKVAS
jgi:hypothetical protein